MTRFVAVGFVVLASLASVADAQTNEPLPNSVLSFEEFFIREDGKYVEPTDAEEHVRYFNMAHCTCAQLGAGDEKTAAYNLNLTNEVNLTSPAVDVYVGENCQVEKNKPTEATCAKIGTIPDIDSIKTTLTKVEVDLYKAVNLEATGACLPRTGTTTLWLLVDRMGDNIYDHWITTPLASPDGAKTKGIDTEAPPVPTNFKAIGSEESISINWDRPTSRDADLEYFQAFCSTVDDQPVFAEGDRPSAQYQRTDEVCGVAAPASLNLTPVGDGSSPSTPFATADPQFLCGESTGTANSLTIEGLENGKAYKVAVVAIDYRGNYAGVYFTQTFTPQPVTDFWEDLNNRDNEIGGGCLLSKTYGDGNPLTQTLRDFRDHTLARSAYGRGLIDAYYATLGKLAVESLAARIVVGILLSPLVALALAWHFLGLPALLAAIALAWVIRRRHSLLHRRWVRAAALTAVVLAPSLASAQTDPESLPFIVSEEPTQEELGAPPIVKWIAGIRVGPYIPDIDLQFPQNGATGMGPYEAMFGDYYLAGSTEKHEKRVWQVLPMLDVARVLWSGSGQLAVGGSLGYMQKTAYAYVDGSSSNDPMRPRSDASKTTFRLIPFSVNATYRFTQLDDLWGIPVVPYLRGGLAYYMWWMTGPNGDISKVGDDKAYGGTPGVEGAAGLMIRAERIDGDAARSMRNSGLQHAGFYGEISWARVDGFNSSSKLWVGDTTWFAGVQFEF